MHQAPFSRIDSVGEYNWSRTIDLMKMYESVEKE
jgi:hypothetical protein